MPASLTVLGIDVAGDPQQVQDRISYMPQRFGLYEDLSVQENLDLYADLHGVSAGRARAALSAADGDDRARPVPRRLAGQLSGGMKQKLGLACTLVRSPELLLLDEPTVGVDPLSRRELWEIVRQLVAEQGLTVLLSTAYLDEAERCSRVDRAAPGQGAGAGPAAAGGRLGRRALLRGHPAGAAIGARAAGAAARSARHRRRGARRRARALRRGRTSPIRLRPMHALRGLSVDAGAAALRGRLHDAAAQHGRARAIASRLPIAHPVAGHAGDAVVQVQRLLKQFGAFTAVDHISFEVRRGEIFGLLGPNGAGKTTTFRMLCGLLPPSGGQLHVAGADVRTRVGRGSRPARAMWRRSSRSTVR